MVTLPPSAVYLLVLRGIYWSNPELVSYDGPLGLAGGNAHLTWFLSRILVYVCFSMNVHRLSIDKKEEENKNSLF